MTEKKTKTPDLAAIVPEGGVVEVDGVRCKIRRMNLLEMASLLRVVTVGAGPALSALGDSQEIDSEQLTGLILLSLPNAAPEFVEFVRVMLVPEDEVPDGWFVNPSVDATFDIIAVIIDQEKDDWEALVGKAKRLWETALQPLLDRSSRVTG